MTGQGFELVDAAAAAYIDWSIRENVPENTIRRRRTVLRSVGNAGTATREEIEAWWRTRGHLMDSSRANDLAVLRAFMRWCQTWEHRIDDPTARIRMPKPPTGAPKPTNRREFDQILTHLADDPPLRRAVLLGAGAGLRVAEAAALEWPDIDVDTRTARAAGKGRKTRIVPFTAKLIDELLPDHGGNVVTGRDRAWSAGYLGTKVNAAIRAAGVDCTFHKLRHRYGSLTYQRTKDPNAVAAALGHASVSTTMKFYAAVADDDLRAVGEAATEDW